MPIVELTIDSSGALTGARQYDAASKQIVSSTKETESAVSNIRKKVNALGPALITAGAAFGVAFAGIAKHAIDAASAMEETQNKFDVVFRGMTETAEGWASHLRQNYLMTSQEAKQFLASTQDLLKPMGVAADMAGEMSFEVAKLATDLGSFNDQPTSQVMSDIQSALVGNYETMKKYGVVLNKARIEANAYTTGLAEQGEALTQAQIAQSALDLIMKGSADAQGDAARSAGSYANQLKLLKSNVGELAIQIGQILLPVATEIITKINDWLIKQGGLNTLLNGSIEIIRGLYNAYQGIVLVLKSVIVAVAKFVEFTVKAFRTVMKPIDLLLTAIEKVGGPKNPFETATEAVEMFSASAVESLTNTWDKTTSFNQAMDELKTKANDSADAMSNATESSDLLSGSLGETSTKGSEAADNLNDIAVAADNVIQATATMTEVVTSGNREITNTYEMVRNAAGEWEKVLVGTRSELIETNVQKDAAANKANVLAQANQTAAASYTGLANNADVARQSISATTAALESAAETGKSAGGGGTGGGGGGGGGAIGWAEVPAWFTEKMAQEYSQAWTKYMTRPTGVDTYTTAPGGGIPDSWKEGFYRKDEALQPGSPEDWARKYGYMDQSGVTDIPGQGGGGGGGISVNINQSMSKSEIAELITELERSQARA